ncbi:hypothetical protein WJX77_008713 [Trebouxia sp. C0004]
MSCKPSFIAFMFFLRGSEQAQTFYQIQGIYLSAQAPTEPNEGSMSFRSSSLKPSQQWLNEDQEQEREHGWASDVVQDGHFSIQRLANFGLNGVWVQIAVAFLCPRVIPVHLCRCFQLLSCGECWFIQAWFEEQHFL